MRLFAKRRSAVRAGATRRSLSPKRAKVRLYSHLISIKTAIGLLQMPEALAYCGMVRSSLLWVTVLGSAVLANACGSKPSVNNHGTDPFDAGSNQDAAAGATGNDDGGGLVVGIGDGGESGGGMSETLSIKAEVSTVTVDVGKAPPEVAIHAFLGKDPVKVAWSVDRGDLASISPGVGSDTALVPTGNSAG